MKTLWVRGIGGLCHELFDPVPSLSPQLSITNGRLDASSCFWAKHLNKHSLDQLVKTLEMNIDRERYRIPQYLSVVSDKNGFIDRAENIPSLLTRENISPQEFFSCLETLEIVCRLYSDFVYHPFSLTLQDGFVLNEDSSKEMYDRCLNPRLNPYLHFITDSVMPLICQNAPDIIFLEGRAGYYLMTIALLSKKVFPNVHICITRHASEYYSMNKLTDLLVQNNCLFQMVDSVILEYFDDIEDKLINALENGTELEQISNLIFRDAGGRIRQTRFAPPANNGIDVFRRWPGTGFGEAEGIADIHLEPYAKCHWNRCTFCGINKKYRHQSMETTDAEWGRKIQYLKKLSETYKYIWFIDEALTPERLRTLAESLLSENIHIIWQARCRADRKLLENGLPELLARAGLRELRIGLESASYFILKQMNKFDDGFSLELMEEIVRVYQANQISIHCPMIVGFPPENAAERQKTYEFLSHLCDISPLFSYNLNILNLDISSNLYREWGKHHLSHIAYPCLPEYFLGNCLAWLPQDEQQQLDHECQTFMREHLYPWMPVSAMLRPTILYRLSETSRATLRWKAKNTWSQRQLFSAEMELQLSSDLAVTKLSDDLYLVYSWESHHYMQGNGLMLDVLEKFRMPRRVSDAVRELAEERADVYRPDEMTRLLQKFHMFRFLVGDYSFRNISTDTELQAAYDRIYREKSYIYNVETDCFLKEWERELKPGKALELGIGAGKNIDFLRHKGYQIVGVDFSAVAVEQAREKYPYSDCAFYLADIRDYVIQKEAFSLIICSLVLSYFSREEASILAQRMVDGLAPGGLLYFLDLSYRDPLSNVPFAQTTDHRRFFTLNDMTSLFSNLDVIELSDVFRIEPRRIGCNGAFGLLYFLGRKPDIE